MTRVLLLLLPSTGYRNRDFLAAANKLGIEIVAAADYCHRLAPAWGMPPLMALHFDQPEQAMQQVLRQVSGPLAGVLAVDDSGVELAALLGERLGLAGNPLAATRRLRDKLAFRQWLRGQPFLCPEFRHLPEGVDPSSLLAGLEFPLVVKARRLSASRGVIRADDEASMLRAVQRVRAIQSRADRDAAGLGLIVERFIPGREYALEGLLVQGSLRTLALFDKPDPLEGPFFEETIYVTPSRLPASLQQAIELEVDRVCQAVGLVTGPVHAELRINEQGIWLLEIASRSIGGLCGSILTRHLGLSLEELILRQVIGQSIPDLPSSPAEASGVMMIPILQRGIFRSVEGLAAAKAVHGITGVTISAEPGQLVAPPPEGASYLGFIFAHAAHPAEVEQALRSAHRELRLVVRQDYAAAEAAIGSAS